MSEHVQFNNSPKPKPEKPVPTKITDVGDVILLETVHNGYRYTVVATRLPFNLTIAGGAMGTHYIFNMWLGRSEPYVVVAMWPQYGVDIDYMLKRAEIDFITVGEIEVLKGMFDVPAE